MGGRVTGLKPSVITPKLHKPLLINDLWGFFVSGVNIG